MTRSSQTALSDLLTHLQGKAELEKSALARELHDELGGLLVATRMDVVWLRRRLDNGDPALKERWDRVLRSLEDGIDFKRRIVEQLRPSLLDNLGLVPALRWLVDETCRKRGIECEEVYPESDIPPIRPECAIALFRAAEEALRNAVEHGKPRRVALELFDEDGSLQLTIRDDGTGIDVEHSGFGLAALQHRIEALGGQTRIGARESGRGTVVELRIPWDRLRPTPAPPMHESAPAAPHVA